MLLLEFIASDNTYISLAFIFVQSERLNVETFLAHFKTGTVLKEDTEVKRPLVSCPLHGEWTELKLQANAIASGSKRTAPHRRDVEERLDTV